MRCRVHYGWIIVAVCMMLIFGASLVSTGMSISINALHRDHGMSGAETSAIITVCSVTAFLFTCIGDRYYMKFGLRNGMFIAAMSGCVAFLIYSASGDTPWIYYVGSVFGGVTYGLGFMLPASILMRRWFTKNRALALSMCSAGSGLSIAIGSPILEKIIDEIDLGISFLTEAAFMAVTAVLILVLVKNHPSDIGAEPLGGPDLSSGKKGRGTHSLTNTAIISLIIAAVFAGICGFPATSHLSLNFTTAGLDDMKVAFGISLFGIVLIVCKLLLGKTMDSKGTYFATMLFGIFAVFGLFGCFAVSGITEYWVLYVSMILIGIGNPIVSLGYPNWASDFSTADEYPRNLRRLQMGYQFGIMAGSFLPGLIFDTAGSYSWAYLLFTFLFASALILVSIAYGKGKKTQVCA